MANYVYSGVSTAALIKKETTWGTAVTPNVGIGFVQSVNVTERNAIARSNAIGSRTTQALVSGPYDIEGTIESDLQTGRLLAYGVGTDTPAQDVTADYTHTLATADVLSSFTMALSHDLTNDIVRTYAGCLIKSFRISGDLTSPLKLSTDFVAKGVSVAASGAIAYNNTTDAVLSPYAGTLSLYGATVAQVQSLEFSLDNGTAVTHAIGQRTGTSYVFAPRTIDLRATFNFEDAEGIAQYKNFLADASSPYTPTEGDVTSGAGSITYNNGIAAGSGKRALTINLTALRITDYAINVPVDGPVTADLSAVVQGFTGTPMVYEDSFTTNYIA